MNNPELPIPPAAPRKKRRWWLYVLIALGSLLLLGVVAVVLFIGYAKSLVSTYTETKPRVFPKVQYDPQRWKALESEWTEFARAVQNRQNPPPFKISADDLNQFFARITNAPFRDHVRFVITNNQLKAEFSAPLEQTRRPELKGRFVNGTATINIIFQEGWLTVNVGAVEANGKPAPGWLLKRLGRENLTKDMDRNRELVNLFGEIDSIQVKDGQIVITPFGSEK
jgi:hypothetical protein